MFDIAIYDSVGQPYTGATTTGIGGSEHFVIKLARALVKSGLKVLVRNNMQTAPQLLDGVVYMPRMMRFDAECKTLIMQRCSALPDDLAFDHMIVQVHDVMSDAHEGLHSLFRHFRPTLVCNSDWQRSLFPAEWKSAVIPPMFHDLPSATTSKDQTSFIYASAAVKGFDQTLNRWRSWRKMYPKLADARLYVISSGYDQPKKVDDPSIHYLGALDDRELHTYIARCAGLFHVNAFEETFGATAAIAEQLGTRTHILCLNGFGALKETLSDHRFVTSDHDRFRTTFLEAYGSDLQQTTTRDYRPETTLNKWLQLV